MAQDPKFPLQPDPVYQERLEQWADEIIKATAAHVNEDPVTATAAVMCAAGRVAAISGLPIDLNMRLFLAQYETMSKLMREYENSLVTPTEGPKSTESN
jgi:hypothetical protein